MNPTQNAKQQQRQRRIQQLLSELVMIRPEDPGYEHKLSLLGASIADPTRERPGRRPALATAVARAARSRGWSALWKRQKARWVHAGGRWLRRLRTFAALPGAAVGAARAPVRSETARGARFEEGCLGPRGQRRYMLYEPASREVGPMPLLVMLHGCQQGAEDFAAGTCMNEVAAHHGVMVLYPEQSVASNALRCWNWYAPQDRSDSEGDAALIAAMTRQVMREHRIDPTRVYVAGMADGGAMAAVLARDYPELFAALGVHSGVPAGIAHDMTAAMRLMSSGPAQPGADIAVPMDGPHRTPVARIVFHGDADTTVHLSNGRAIHAAGARERDQPQAADSLHITTPPEGAQRGFTRSVEYGPTGESRNELWIVHGGGHAWAGGNDEHKHTDANGPDASREMMRFFLQHRLAGAAA